jgi:anti-sigma regulatory factor (Ser/Thr protein kinase)
MNTVTLDRRDAPRAARRLVAAECASAGTGPQCAQAAAVLTSEVVTNAVRHGSGDITLGFLAGRLLVLVEVGDDDVRTPRAREFHHDDDEGGRGLQIVNALAAGWGVRSNPPGKIVWFTVPAQP